MTLARSLSTLLAITLLAACSKEVVKPDAKPQQPKSTPAEAAAIQKAEAITPTATPAETVKAAAIKNEPLLLPSVDHYQAEIKSLCREIGNKLGSVSVANCDAHKMQTSGFNSVQNRSVAIKEYPPLDGVESLGRVLVIGGIHGDEYASISIAFKWMQQLEQERDGRLHWRFIPLSNPDGLLRKKSQRQNANGVDLNRNFPSSDWDRLALDYWHNKTYKNKRRYPGAKSASEPETIGLLKQIETFKPDIIVSIHAPYHLLDYDGPSKAPKQIGDLHLHELGVYPGSLGNYGGLDLQLPVVTLELPSAGIMPKPKEIRHMWHDLNKWLLNERQVAANKRRGEQLASNSDEQK